MRCSLDVDVIVKLNSSFVEEKDFLGLISLIVKSIIFKNSHLLKHGDKSPDELLIFAFEKLNFLNDVLMSEMNNS